MLVLVGPSASGKSAIVKQLGKEYGIKKFITCTTRNKRIGEEDGIDYYFMTKDEFTNRYNNNEFIETVFYNGNYYGTLKKEATNDKVVILEPQGLKRFNQTINQVFSVFLKTDEDILRRRMISRGDSILDVNMRLENDVILFNEEQLSCIDYIIDTSKLSIEEIASIIMEKYNEFLKK